MKEQIREAIQKAIAKAYPEDKDIKFDVDHAEPHADFASNVAMVLAKPLGKKPMDIAEEIASSLSAPRNDNFQVAVAPPGFLNFNISEEYLENNLRDIVRQKDDYGSPEKKSKQKILVEYFQPNIAKHLHVGHMRSAIIGDCLYRLNKLFVKKVESDTHMGDWGTQFGLLLRAYKKWGDEKTVSLNPLEELNKLYVKINHEIENNPGLKEEGKREFVKLELGDKENRKLWKQFVHWSMERFLKINKLLEISEFDHHWPESFYEDKMPAVVEGLKKKKLLTESQSAQIVDLSKYALGTAIIIKSDGGTTYLLRDLATFIYRKHDQHFTRQLYVVDSRQSHAFRQLFKILELLGEWKPGEGEHVDFGFMSLPEGILSTRKGSIIELEEVVAKAKEKASQVIAEKNPELKNRDEVARMVAIGALKYFDLSRNRHSDIVFAWNKALDFNGNSGPYLQYTHARIQSILRKSKEKPMPKNYNFMKDDERELLKALGKFPSEAEKAWLDSLPNRLTDYLYSLASLFNKYYQEVRVLQEEDESLRKSRLILLEGVAQVLKNGLSLLGIEAPGKM